MRLNGVYAEPGTLIGMHQRDFRPIIVSHVSKPHIPQSVLIDYATNEDVIVRHEPPRSVAEHHAIPRRMSPYGLIRQYAPVPLPRVEYPSALPSMIVSRRTRRKLKKAIEKGHIKHIHTTGHYR
jgi:hypothetical protein